MVMMPDTIKDAVVSLTVASAHPVPFQYCHVDSHIGPRSHPQRLLDDPRGPIQEAFAHIFVRDNQPYFVAPALTKPNGPDPGVELLRVQPLRQRCHRLLPEHVRRTFVRCPEADVQRPVWLARALKGHEGARTLDIVEHEVVMSDDCLGDGRPFAQPRRYRDRLNGWWSESRRHTTIASRIGKLDPLILAVVPSHQAGAYPVTRRSVHRHGCH